MDEKFIKSVITEVSEKGGIFGSAAKIYIDADSEIQAKYIAEIYDNFTDNTKSPYRERWGEELLTKMKTIWEHMNSNATDAKAV